MGTTTMGNLNISQPSVRGATSQAGRDDAPDYRDMAIEVLVDSEARLLARVADLELNVATHHELAEWLIRKLTDLTHRHKLLTFRLHRVLDDVRALRAEKRNAA
jgi:hypothetical protein